MDRPSPTDRAEVTSFSNATAQAPIQLSDRTRLSGGTRRAVHVVPQLGPQVVVKVQDFAHEWQRMTPLKRRLRRLFPGSRYRMMRAEMRHQMERFLTLDARDEIPLARFCGLVSTNLGPAAVWEAVRGPDGNLAPTLKQSRDLGLDALLPALNRFATQLFDYRIVVSDLNTENMVLQDGSDGIYLKLIDGFGDQNVIKLMTLIPAIGDRRRNRKLRHLAKQMRVTWDAKARRFIRPNG